MKKLIIIAISIIVIAIISAFAFMQVSSYHKVTFAFGDDVTGATLFRIKESEAGNHEIAGDEIQKITATSEVSLQNGGYYVVPEGEKVSKSDISFTVADQDMTVDVKPGYSDEFLKSAYVKEKPAIETAMKQAFPLIASDYTPEQGALYGKADWYGAILTKKVADPRDERDFYRIVMHKANGDWKVINQPELVLTSAQFKDVPVEVLRSVNKLTR